MKGGRMRFGCLEYEGKSRVCGSPARVARALCEWEVRRKKKSLRPGQ